VQEVDSQALQLVAKVLQLSTGGSELTEFQDELLQQALDVSAIVRRGLTVAGSEGIFTASILNTHVGSDTITNDVNPYTMVGATFVGNAWPNPVGPEFDVWVLQANGINVTAPGDFGGGFWGLISDPNAMAWRNEANALAQIEPHSLYLQEVTFGGSVHLSDNSGVSLWSHFGQTRLRVPRGADTRIRFQTVKSGVGAASYKLKLTLGLFPTGMGQDVT